jgi:tetratricopeptide (TPR) repeat protein
VAPGHLAAPGRVVVLGVALALVLSSAGASATPRQDLDKAHAAFRKGEFGVALPLYNVLLYPNPQLASAEDLSDAYIALGVCRLETGDGDGAKREFEKALQIDPNKQLDPLLVRNREAIRLFDDTKADLRTRAEREAEKKKAAELIEKQKAYLASLRVYKAQYFALNFVPFGLGQFQNGDTGKGIFFLGSELVTAGTSIAIWGYLVNKYGIRSDRVPYEEGPGVRRLQQIEIGAGLAFYGLWLLGAIDSYRHYEPQKRIQGDESLLPPELREPEKNKNGKPKKASFHILPMVTPNGAGIGIGWEN